MSIHIFAIVKLEDAIKQKKFRSQHIRAAINLHYASSQLQHFENSILKNYGISLQQFNLMRIVRGQKGKPISISEITDRMIDKMSNASRLAEKLRAKGLLARQICPKDRRKVEIILTDKGQSVIADASQTIDSAINKRLSVLSKDEAEELNRILDKVTMASSGSEYFITNN